MDGMLAKSISLANKLLDDNKTMESTVEGIMWLINIGLMEMEEFKTINNYIGKTDVGFQVPMAVPNKFKITLGKYLTNCTKCNIICHRLCGNDCEKSDCDDLHHSKPISVRTYIVFPITSCGLFMPISRFGGISTDRNWRLCYITAGQKD